MRIVVRIVDAGRLFPRLKISAADPDAAPRITALALAGKIEAAVPPPAILRNHELAAHPGS